MIYLKDTCVFIHKLDSNSIVQLLQNYKNSSDSFGVTDIILNELEPGKAIPVADAEKSQSMLTLISLIQKSKSFVLFNVEKDEKFIKNFKQIRKRFYGHLDDLKAVKKAIENKEISIESFKNRSYKRKDYGECSCIAVAMLDSNEICIVSDDKGRIFLKPEVNLFEKYKESHNIKVLNYDEWLNVFDKAKTQIN